ncbi:MAG: hypothetical protein KKE39_06785 [Bacteroidetes bacterium]|nr:hypothetical protein [Bacteroidota bacterium]MBU1371326.1 hypothetical protein [Bacteroidota bacterium]MBU1485813.1 hypothetical protein [Bacteroidota bacterium]MBU1760904.1 hypothetical protein [Bacteroidota bacterium]MBU2046624.1 hypothetical protein [Bacteroidota bacterium]
MKKNDLRLVIATILLLLAIVNFLPIMKSLNLISWYSRVSLFIIYFWFGILKVFVLSPAEELVKHLHHITYAVLFHFDTFFRLFGVYECLIGILWLFPKFTKVAFILILIHLTLTVMPMFLLQADTWSHALIPTFIGQYIIKNLILLALALFLFHFSKLDPYLKRNKV